MAYDTRTGDDQLDSQLEAALDEKYLESCEAGMGKVRLHLPDGTRLELTYEQAKRFWGAILKAPPSL